MDNAVSLENRELKERLPLKGFDRQTRLLIEIPRHERYVYLVIGFGLAAVDVIFTWLQFQELSSDTSIKAIFGCAGVFLGILNFYITPLSLKLFPRGIWFRAIPLFLIGLVLTLVDIGATIGFMASAADNEEFNADLVRRANENKQAAIIALSQSIKSSTESEKTQRETQRAFNDIGRLSKANASGSTLLQLEKTKAKTADNLYRMANEKPNKIESRSQLTSLYSSVANIFGIDYKTSRKWFEVIFAVIIPLGSICSLTLGKAPAKIRSTSRKDDELPPSCPLPPPHCPPIVESEKKEDVPPQEPVPIRGGTRQEVANYKRQKPNRIGFMNKKVPSKPIKRKVSIDLAKANSTPIETEKFSAEVLEQIMQDIISGKLKSLSRTYLTEVYKCGSKSAEKIRKHAIKSKLAKKIGTSGRVEIINKG
jgi:hypothetical protein